MNRLKRMFLRDGYRKIVALLLAVILYCAVAFRITKDKLMENVPVKITYSSELAGPAKATTNVTIKGSEEKIKKVSANDFTAHVVVTPSHYVTGNTYIVKLTPSMFKTKSGITVDSCEKLILQDVQKVISKKVPVEVKYSGKLSRDFDITESLVIPSEVTITGAENVVSARRSVTTSAIPLSRTIFDSFEFNAPVAPVKDVKIEPENVLVQTSVSKRMEHKKFKAVPVLLLAGAGQSDFAVTFAKPDTTVDIVVSGPPSILAFVKPDSFKPYVDASKVTSPATVMLPVECTSSIEGVLIKATSPGEVAVKVSRIKK